MEGNIEGNASDETCPVFLIVWSGRILGLRRKVKGRQPGWVCRRLRANVRSPTMPTHARNMPTFPLRLEQHRSICALALRPNTPFFLTRQRPSFFQKSACFSPHVTTPPSASKQHPRTCFVPRENANIVVERTRKSKPGRCESHKMRFSSAPTDQLLQR